MSARARSDVPGTHVAAWIMVLGVLLPLALAAAKLSGLAVTEPLARTLSFQGLPAPITAQLRLVMLVPLGAVVVVLFRLTLGVRVLGPFRPILIAIALELTGIGAGLVFLVLVMASIAAIRPLVRGARLPYFARVAVLVSTVAVLVAGTVLAGHWLRADSLLQVAFFPIVVLCLVAESFARTLYDEGAPSAVWRAVTTIAAALTIAGVAAVPGLLDGLLAFPELALLSLPAIVWIARRLDLRVLSSLNPPPRESGGERTAPARQARGGGASKRSRARAGNAAVRPDPIHS
jgi:hypothetical protein